MNAMTVQALWIKLPSRGLAPPGNKDGFVRPSTSIHERTAPANPL